jgi:ribosome-associated protein
MLPNRNALAPRNDPQEDDAQEDAVDTRSKTRRKRDAEALQALGERLVELKPSRLARVPLDERLREEILTAQRIQARGARRRQLQLIGRLMRSADAAAIANALARLEAGALTVSGDAAPGPGK